MNTIKGMIFNIQKGSLEDGKGFRTVVFFKGCNLACIWCHNPESQSAERQILYYEQLCKSCFSCFEACPQKIIEIRNEKILYDRTKCLACGTCADNCQNKALVKMGQQVSVDEVIKIVEKDKNYFDATGGGVTLSGGEAALQTEFLNALVRELDQKKIKTSLETNGNFDSAKVGVSLRLFDCIYLDLKAIDRDKHLKLTGIGNDRILSNLGVLSAISRNLVVRYLIVPGQNDSNNDLNLLLDLLKKNNIHKLEVLKFHKFWIEKLSALGRNISEDISAITDEMIDQSYVMAIDFLNENKNRDLVLTKH